MILFHADDYGITLKQARSLLSLSCACGGSGPLNSFSAFANSPCFEEAAALVAPYVVKWSLPKTGVDVDQGSNVTPAGVFFGVHLNIVEGPCSAPASELPLLVDERGMFKMGFLEILKDSLGAMRYELQAEITYEFTAQIERFLRVFPEQRSVLQLDSHQHTHTIPLVFDALLDAVCRCDASIGRLRLPYESLEPYRSANLLSEVSFSNRLKLWLLNRLRRRTIHQVPASCSTSVFCGVALSGNMDKFSLTLMDALDAQVRHNPASSCDAKDHYKTDIELLFHPVRVVQEECLDPHNIAYAHACASDAREREAQRLLLLKKELDATAKEHRKFSN